MSAIPESRRPRPDDNRPAVLSARSACTALAAVALGLGAIGLATIAVAADSPLIEAARNSDAERIVTLLAGGADVLAPAADGSQAVHFAAESGQLSVIEPLLAAGADVEAKTRNGVTPLAIAALGGADDVVNALLANGADPNGPSGEGETPLMLAAMNGEPAAVSLLLARGADPNVAEPYRGQTALMWAAGSGNADAVSLLVADGAVIDARSDTGFTPLLFAVRNAQRDALRVLIESGADTNVLAPDGTSALNVAVVNGYYDVAAELLAHGADPNLPDPRGSPLHTIAWLREPGATGNAAVGAEADAPVRASGDVTSLELAKLLLAAGAEPNVRIDWDEGRFNKLGGTARNPPGLVLGRHLLTYNGATAFYIAAKNGDAPLMRVLADAGADPLLTNRFGITPLMVAAGLDTWEGETPGPHTGVTEAERLDAIDLAVELGNDINATADFGDLPMEGPPEYTLLYYPYNVDELAELGAGDPRWDDSTALHGSIISNQPSITRYLVDRGAKIDVENALGWTPLMMARGVFLANASREFPAAEAILVEALGQPVNE